MLKIINKSENEIFYATLLSAGFDIPANHDQVLPPRSITLIKTGLYLGELDPDLVKNFQVFAGMLGGGIALIPELQIRSRSGAAKKGVRVANSPGTVDADYPGEIGVLLENTNDFEVTIGKGARIAQGVVALVARAVGVNVKDVKRTGGFGST